MSVQAYSWRIPNLFCFVYPWPNKKSIIYPHLLSFFVSFPPCQRNFLGVPHISSSFAVISKKKVSRPETTFFCGFSAYCIFTVFIGLILISAGAVLLSGNENVVERQSSATLLLFCTDNWSLLQFIIQQIYPLGRQNLLLGLAWG